jgi:urease accessory protein
LKNIHFSISRLEWLPQETLCYSGCHAENNLRLEIAPGPGLRGRCDVVAWFGRRRSGRLFRRCGTVWMKQAQRQV